MLGGGQEEQVADPVQVDLLTGAHAEPAEGLQAARTELDVDPVGELGTDAARGLAGRALAELVPFEQHDIADARLGEVEGDAGADRPTSDDDDVGGGRKGPGGAVHGQRSASSPGCMVHRAFVRVQRGEVRTVPTDRRGAGRQSSAQRVPQAPSTRTPAISSSTASSPAYAPDGRGQCRTASVNPSSAARPAASVNAPKLVNDGIGPRVQAQHPGHRRRIPACRGGGLLEGAHEVGEPRPPPVGVVTRIGGPGGRPAVGAGGDPDRPRPGGGHNEHDPLPAARGDHLRVPGLVVVPSPGRVRLPQEQVGQGDELVQPGHQLPRRERFSAEHPRVPARSARTDGRDEASPGDVVEGHQVLGGRHRVAEVGGGDPRAQAERARGGGRGDQRRDRRVPGFVGQVPPGQVVVGPAVGEPALFQRRPSRPGLGPAELGEDHDADAHRPMLPSAPRAPFSGCGTRRRRPVRCR